MEKLVEFTVEGEKLIGTICAPEGKGPFPGVAFFHGRISSRKNYIPLCHKLALMGIVAFCFDFRGCGESEGRLEDSTVSARLKDARAALKFFLSQEKVSPRKIGICGSSLGGHLGAVLAGENKNIVSLVLRAPSSMVGERMGVEGSEAMKAMQRFKGSLLVIQSELDEEIPKETIDAYLNNAKNPVKSPDSIGGHGASAKGKKLYVIKGATHSLTNSIWRQEFNQVVCDWFERSLQ